MHKHLGIYKGVTWPNETICTGNGFGSAKKNPAIFEIPLLRGKKAERKEEMAINSHISGYSLLDYKHSNHPRASTRFCFTPLNNMNFINDFFSLC